MSVQMVLAQFNEMLWRSRGRSEKDLRVDVTAELLNPYLIESRYGIHCKNDQHALFNWLIIGVLQDRLLRSSPVDEGCELATTAYNRL